LNDNNTHTACIQNGEFSELVNPNTTDDNCGMYDLSLNNGSVYSAGYFFYDKTNAQPVYWTSTTPTAVNMPPIDYPSIFATGLAVKSSTDIQLIIQNILWKYPMMVLLM